MSLTNVETIFKEAEDRLQAHDANEELMENIKKLRASAIKVASYAHEYDFQDLKANGFRTFIRLVMSFLQKYVELYVRKGKNLDHLVEVTRLFLLEFNYFERIREISIQDQNANDDAMDLEHFKQVFFKYQELLKHNHEFGTLHGYFGPFWLDRKHRKFLRKFITLTSFYSYRITGCPSALFSKRRRGDGYITSMNAATFNFPFNIQELLDITIYKKIVFNSIYFRCNHKLKTIYIPKRSTWFIPDCGGKVFKAIEELAVEKQMIRCRLIKPKRPPSNMDRLVIHCHGGGFGGQTPDCHEIYLRDWANKMEGTAILSIDYSVKAHFPLPLQEALHVYLWIISGKPEVRKTLGYIPVNIILAGDSAGGNIMTSLLMVLNDIRKYRSILFPKGILNIYSIFDLSPRVLSSYSLIGYDTFLNRGVVLACLGIYSGIEDSPENRSREKPNVLQKVYRPLHKDMKILGNFFKPRQLKPWYLCEEEEFVNKLNSKRELFRSPYISPLKFDRFNELQDVSAAFLCINQCPFLDQSILMAKKWKGKVDIKVYDGLFHGFLHTHFGCKKTIEASAQCAQMLNKIFDQER